MHVWRWCRLQNVTFTLHNVKWCTFEGDVVHKTLCLRNLVTKNVRSKVILLTRRYIYVTSCNKSTCILWRPQAGAAHAFNGMMLRLHARPTLLGYDNHYKPTHMGPQLFPYTRCFLIVPLSLRRRRTTHYPLQSFARCHKNSSSIQHVCMHTYPLPFP